MSYCNKLIEPPKPPSHPLKFLVYKAGKLVRKTKYSFLRIVVHFKLILRKHGYEVYISCNEMIAAKLEKHPRREWKWDSEETPSEQEITRLIDVEILPWIHENVMRAPAPLGYDWSGIMIWVVCCDEDVAQQIRMVDKYGWRKYGRSETSTWLFENMIKYKDEGIEVIAKTLSFGKFIISYIYGWNEGQYHGGASG